MELTGFPLLVLTLLLAGTDGFPKRDISTHLENFRSHRVTRSDVHIRVCAFNIKTFGRSKMSNEVVANLIKEIVWLYDLILIQEIRDSSGDSYKQLLDMVAVPDKPFDMVISERLGRSSYKEQYAYFYRTDKLQLLDTHQYADTEDIFEREPYSALFQPIGADTGAEFAVMGIHAKPSDAVEEIGFLNDAYEDLVKAWNPLNTIIMGDFNADCSYASEEDLRDLEIYNSPYNWLVGMHADTTTYSTDCAYDRIVIVGDRLNEAVQNDAKADDDTLVFHFEKHFDLSDDEKRNYELRLKEQRYKKGDQVWLYTPIRSKGSSKLQSCWGGPYVIVDALSDVTFRVRAPEGKMKDVSDHYPVAVSFDF